MTQIARLISRIDEKHSLLFVYSGFLRGLRYKKSREGTLRDSPANAQMSEVIGRRNSTAGENAGSTENQ